MVREGREGSLVSIPHSKGIKVFQKKVTISYKNRYERKGVRV
jgi:hypothetical protein